MDFLRLVCPSVALAAFAFGCGGIASTTPSPSGIGDGTTSPSSNSSACPAASLTLLVPVAPTTALGSSVGGLAMDENDLYFTTSASSESAGGVWRVSKCGGSPTRLAVAGRGPASIVVDAQYVYWADQVEGTISRVPVQGGPAVQLVGDPHAFPMSLALDDASVYWVSLLDAYPSRPDQVTVLAMPKQGGATSTLFASGTDLSGLAVDASGVYVAGVGPRDTVSPPTESLYRASLSSTSVQLAPDTACDDVVVQGPLAYCRYERTVSLVPLQGHSPPGKITLDHAIAGLAVSGGSIFVTTVGSPDPNTYGLLSDAKLRLVDGPGGTSTDLATGLSYPSVVRVDDTNLYFAARQGIYAIARP